MSNTELVETKRTEIVKPLAKPQEIIEAHKALSDIINEALEKDRDYGTIPNTEKPTLLKPGAERVCIAFGASPNYEAVQSEIDHDREVNWIKKKKKWNNKFKGDHSYEWEEVSGTSYGVYRYVIRCRLTRPDGRVLGDGLGSCSTMESKYIDRPRDLENTVLKMAEKRAFVAATLNAFGLSDRFTQDMEDISNDVVQTTATATAPLSEEVPFAPQQSEPSQNTKSDYKISEKQQKLLFARTKAAGLDIRDIQAEMKTKWGIEKSSDLTKTQLDEMLKLIEENKLK